MNYAYLLTGGNVGDRHQHLAMAREHLAGECGVLRSLSSLYETAAWGNTEQPAFLNQAIGLSTDLNARQLMRKILKIEKQMGRVRSEKFSPRIIDIDILLFNDIQCNYHFLKLPHPEMANRRFVLLPLAEIAPLVVHPVYNKTIMQLLVECKDKLPVRRLE